MSPTTLYIIFAIEFLILVALLWFITKLRYFASLFISSIILLPAFYLLFSYISKVEPAILSNPLVKFLTPYWLMFLNKAVKIIPIILGALLLLFGVFFFLLRPLIAKVSELLFKLKIRLFEPQAEGIKKIQFDITKYLSSDSKYFIGLSAKKVPQYVDQPTLTTHMQVVGPSGCGKTASVLFPLAVQALKKKVPVIFVDGKGDAKLKQLLQSFSAKENIPMQFFDPLQPDISHTYNPLTSSTDANEITNLLAVGLNLNAPGEAKVYTDIQKKFLATLLHIFVQTGMKFNFIDMVEFMNHGSSREIVYNIIKNLNKDKFYETEMKTFLARLSKSERELIGLVTILDQLFVADEKISELINTYEPDIDIRKILEQGGAVLFSFSAGMKAQTNEALAKMVLADIANAVGERHATSGDHKFAMIILDEFGQYVSEAFDKFISTARSANISCILSHQSNAQLETYFSGDKLARVVRENTACKIIFRQSEEASFWAECFGTKQAMKRTEQVETGPLMTETVSQMGTLREVDEFIIHPNAFRKLDVGQAVFKLKEQEPEILNLGMYPVTNNFQPQPLTHSFGEGLNLRQRRMEQLEKESKEQQQKQYQVQNTQRKSARYEK